MTFRMGMTLESLQYFYNHEPQRFDFGIECKPTDRTWQLYYHQVKIMIVYKVAIQCLDEVSCDTNFDFSLLI